MWGNAGGVTTWPVPVCTEPLGLRAEEDPCTHQRSMKWSLEHCFMCSSALADSNTPLFPSPESTFLGSLVRCLFERKFYPLCFWLWQMDLGMCKPLPEQQSAWALQTAPCAFRWLLWSDHPFSEVSDRAPAVLRCSSSHPAVSSPGCLQSPPHHAMHCGHRWAWCSVQLRCPGKTHFVPRSWGLSPLGCSAFHWLRRRTFLTARSNPAMEAEHSLYGFV